MSDLAAPYRRMGALDGACLCGATRIRVDGDYVAAVGICHCRICRVWSGTITGYFTASHDAVTVDGPVKTYASTSFASRAFCEVCGANLWLRNNGPEDEYEFVPALFRDADMFPVISEIYCDRAPAYGHLKGDHKRATQAEYEAKNLFVEGDKP
jgi:hypothetical protein